MRTTTKGMEWHPKMGRFKYRRSCDKGCELRSFVFGLKRTTTTTTTTTKFRISVS